MPIGVFKSGMGALTRRRFINFFLFGTFLSIPFLLGRCARHSSSTETGSNLKTETKSKFAPQVENEPVPFRWEEVSTADVDKVKNSLQFQGEIKPDATKGAGLFIIVGVVLLVHLAKTVLELMREWKYGGLVIDTRGDEIIIKPDKRLPANIIVIIDKDEATFHKLYEFDTVSDLAKIVYEAFDKSR